MPVIRSWSYHLYAQTYLSLSFVPPFTQIPCQKKTHGLTFPPPRRSAPPQWVCSRRLSAAGRRRGSGLCGGRPGWTASPAWVLHCTRERRRLGGPCPVPLPCATAPAPQAGTTHSGGVMPRSTSMPSRSPASGTSDSDRSTTWTELIWSLLERKRGC